jgi:hypothetical protein
VGFGRNYKNTLVVFQRRVLRKIFDPTKEREVLGESKQIMN